MAYTVYLAGPMTNRPGFNFPLFFDAAKQLREQFNYDVLSPAEKDLEDIPEWLFLQNDTGDLARLVRESAENGTPFTLKNAMEWDLPAILKSNGIVLLPQWETSTGARWERTVAEALDRDILLMKPVEVAGQDPVWLLSPDLEQKRISEYLKGFAPPSEKVRYA